MGLSWQQGPLSPGAIGRFLAFPSHCLRGSSMPNRYVDACECVSLVRGSPIANTSFSFSSLIAILWPTFPRPTLFQAPRNLPSILPGTATWVLRPGTASARVDKAHGPAADSILRTAVRKRADLIVLGVRARQGLTDRLIWPNAYRIVCDSRCPVLSVRMPEPRSA